MSATKPTKAERHAVQVRIAVALERIAEAAQKSVEETNMARRFLQQIWSTRP